LDGDFLEIYTPKLTPKLSEGGANVFQLNLFGSPACLAQSPQLYKQIMVTGDLMKVLEIGPVSVIECGIHVDSTSSYLESFKYGTWPNAGGGIGLERVVMLFLGLDNIRKTSLFSRTPSRLIP
jgi:aspartyl/asparaginyl-tRNA synthetase